MVNIRQKFDHYLRGHSSAPGSKFEKMKKTPGVFFVLNDHSQNETRPGIPSLHVDLYVAQNGVRRMFGWRDTSGRLPAITLPYEPEYGRKERFGGSRGETGSRNMAATRFSDSATPTCVKIESRPKYTTTSGLTSTTFFANFSENN